MSISLVQPQVEWIGWNHVYKDRRGLSVRVEEQWVEPGYVVLSNTHTNMNDVSDLLSDL